MTSEQVTAAKLLRARGLSYRRIAGIVGVAHATVQRALKPQFAEWCRQRMRENYKVNQEQRREYARNRYHSDPVVRQSRINDASRWRKENPMKYKEHDKARHARRCHPRITYFIQCGNFVKIGTTKNLSHRLEAIQTHCPEECKLLGTTTVSEAEVHAKFEHLRHRGEWFWLTPRIEHFIEKFS